MLATLLKRKIKFWRAVLACVNFILRDELAQLVGTLNKWDQVHCHRVIQSPGETVSFAYSGLLSRPTPAPGACEPPILGGPRPNREFKSMQIHYHPGKPVEGLAKPWQQHCFWYASLPSTCAGLKMRVPLFSCCSMYARDHRGFSFMWNLRKEKKNTMGTFEFIYYMGN